MVEFQRMQGDDSVAKVAGVKLEAAIAAPEATLTQQRVLSEGRVHAGDGIDRRLHLTFDRWIHRQWFTWKIVVDVPGAFTVPLRGDGEQQRPYLFQADRWQPA